MGENVHLEKNVAEGVAVIRLDRPKVNALSSDMMRDLHAICDELAVDDTTRAVVVTGGRKNFAAGADISEFGPDVSLAFCAANDISCIVRSHQYVRQVGHTPRRRAAWETSRLRSSPRFARWRSRPPSRE